MAAPVNDVPRAIKATFSDWRTVKGRKALQLVFEVSLEQQAEVLTMLGAPMPDDPKWCAIAVMETAKVEPTKQRHAVTQRRGWYDMPASQRAGILCREPKFREWIVAHWGMRPADDDETAHWLCASLSIDSRSELRPEINEKAVLDFMAIEQEYRIWAGLETAPR